MKYAGRLQKQLVWLISKTKTCGWSKLAGGPKWIRFPFTISVRFGPALLAGHFFCHRWRSHIRMDPNLENVIRRVNVDAEIRRQSAKKLPGLLHAKPTYSVGRKAKPIYISLMTYTDHAFRNIKKSPSRVNAAHKVAEERGGNIMGDLYLTMGAYEFVAISHFPDEATAATYVLRLGALATCAQRLSRRCPECVPQDRRSGVRDTGPRHLGLCAQSGRISRSCVGRMSDWGLGCVKTFVQD